MNPKYLVLLYAIAATVTVGLVIYLAATTSPIPNTTRIVVDIVVALFLYYMAYKTYHEKKDKELM